MRRRRWPWVVLGSVLVLVLVAKHFLLDTPVAARSNFVIDLDALHRAAIGSGPLPDHIEVEKVAEFGFPRTLVVAGQGFKTHRMVLLAHRVMWPDHSLMIDTGMAPEATKVMPGSQADPAAFDRVVKAMKQASTIVFTHEHEDHVGGIAGAPAPVSLTPQARMTREQLDSRRLERDHFPAGVLEKLVALEYSGVHAVAPGVVLQKAPGHSPGSQLVYVELANGARYLFVGDIAWTTDNIRLQIGRPGIATLLMGEDREAVASQVKALAGLPRDLHVVVAHDGVELEDDVKRGLIRKGFSGI